MSDHLEDENAHYPIKTVHGRVVYDRKTHKFSHCDLRRMHKGLQDTTSPRQRFCEAVFQAEVLGKIKDLPTEAARKARTLLEVLLWDRAADIAGPAWSAWGGGGTGGSGATGDFKFPILKPFDV